MYKVKIRKDVEDSPIFVVVNTESMLWEGYQKEINSVVLHDTSTEEFIKVLSKTKEKSIKYLYFLCMANCIEALDGLRDLVAFMKDEGFSYYISPEQTEMYRQTIIDSVTENVQEVAYGA